MEADWIRNLAKEMWCTSFAIDEDELEGEIRRHLPPGVFVPELCKCGKPMEPPTMCYLCLCGVPLAKRKRGVFVPMEVAEHWVANAKPECALCDEVIKLVEAAKAKEARKIANLETAFLGESLKAAKAKEGET